MYAQICTYVICIYTRSILHMYYIIYIYCTYLFMLYVYPVSLYACGDIDRSIEAVIDYVPCGYGYWYMPLARKIFISPGISKVYQSIFVGLEPLFWCFIVWGGISINQIALNATNSVGHCCLLVARSAASGMKWGVTIIGPSSECEQCIPAQKICLHVYLCTLFVYCIVCTFIQVNIHTCMYIHF